MWFLCSTLANELQFATHFWQASLVVFVDARWSVLLSSFDGVSDADATSCGRGSRSTPQLT
jgi:hypothetical protein